MKLILGKGKRDSITEALKQLHWLNADACVTFKVLLIVYNVVHGMCSQELQLQYKGFNGRPNNFLLLPQRQRSRQHLWKTSVWITTMECTGYECTCLGKHRTIQKVCENNLVRGK